MSNLKRVGVILILFGFFIPLVSYPFTELTDKARTDLFRLSAGKSPRLIELEVQSIPYPYFIAIGLTLIFIGVGFIVLSGKKKPEES